MNDDTLDASPPSGGRTTDNPSARKACLACDRDSDETPLVCLEYRGAPLWICSQHMPLLIHQPEKLVDHLPGD